MSVRLKLAVVLMALGCTTHAQTSSILNSGLWYKFSVATDGIYKIDYGMLKKAGFDPDNLDPRNLQLFTSTSSMLPQANSAARINHPKQLAIVVQGEGDGKFDKSDFILFWGLGPDGHDFIASKNTFSYQNHLYDDNNFYFLTVGGQAGKRNSTTSDSGTGFPVVSQFDDFGYYETNQYNILKSGRVWYGEQFDANNEITVRYDIPGIIPNTPITLVSAVMARAFAVGSSFKISVNGNQVIEQQVDSIQNTQYGVKGKDQQDTVVFNSDAVSASSRAAQDITYHYTKAPSGISVGYLNYFLISMKRALALYGNQTVFRSSQSLINPVSQFSIGSAGDNSIIWDVSDPFEASIQNFSLNQSQAQFSVATNELKTFVIFNPDKIPGVTLVESIDNQDLVNMSSPDLIIITAPELKSEAMRLAGHRQSHDNLNVEVVTTNEVYNEYSGGKQDVTAIRDFIKELYNRSGAGLDNVLLFGRCSYDYKDRSKENTNLVPTYESLNSLSPLETYSSDDYFTFMELNEGEWEESFSDNSTMDVGVGRISVAKLEDAQNVVDKLIAYDTDPKGFGSWRQKIVFVADDGNSNLHQNQANQLATDIDLNHPEFITKRIYVDDFKQILKSIGQFSPDASGELDRTVETGAMIINYTGHGSEDVWMDERILVPDMIYEWKNGPRYPLFVTATCEFGRHDDPAGTSSGEKLFIQKKGGGIGLVTTARPVNSSTNFSLNNAFYDALFTKESGQYRRLGIVFRDTKNNSTSGVANRNFSLIGDPSMKLAFPGDDVVANEVKTIFDSDTLKALSTVTIKGEIQRAGTLQTGFQGEADISLFDRPSSFTTLGDENTPYTYTQSTNLLFRGSATVNNGKFVLELIVPKDLEEDVAQGKLTVYAHNDQENAAGSKLVKVGGVETIFPDDETPPELKLFVGDTTFTDGGVASPNTTLITQLIQDDHGLSITGLSGANNLLAVLDDSLSFIMNDYYSAKKDDYTKGWAYFPLRDLPKGRHHVVVNASDTYGNRTSSTIEFIVTDDALVISSFYNYPNPFWSLTESTILGFTHNRPGEDLEAEVVIYDLSGQLVTSWRYSVPESLTKVTLAEWDGSNTFGNKLSNGIYLGKLFVRSLLDGSKNEQFTKLIIVN